jgi:FKBP-type peptidyl-prolyl cis-trans isomerase FkpA
MKQTIFTLLLLSTIGMVSCRKTGTEPNIQQYDQSQIINYIKTNNITGMKQDTVGGDTSGIYYKIIQTGTGTPLTYSDEISAVFTLRSFDGSYASTDTIENHFFGYVGHITSSGLPLGLEIAILNDLKYSGGSARILIPSNLAYGVLGYGTGSINNPGSHIAGNQCLDYYVHIIAKQPDVINAQATYDTQLIKNYLAANNLTSLYTPEVDTGGTIYYRIQTPGTGTDPITDNSTIQVTYNARLLNGVVFDGQNPTTGVDSTSFDVPDLTAGVAATLKKHAVKGSVISMLIPSALGYGTVGQTGIPANSVLRFEFTIVDVSP